MQSSILISQLTPVTKGASFSNPNPSSTCWLAEYFTNKCGTCGALRTAAEVGVVSVLAGASVSARLAQTLVDVGLTQSSGVSWVAVAAEGC